MARRVAQIKSELNEQLQLLARLKCELRQATIHEQLQRSANERMREVKREVLARLEAGEAVVGFNGRFWWGSAEAPVKRRVNGDELRALNELSAAGIVDRGET